MNIEPIHSKNGKTYWVEQGDTLYAQRLQAGQYQSRNWEFAQTILPQFRRCLDIGSNNAVNAIHYAERFDWVECWEPTPLAQQLWHRTVRDNGVANATLHSQALGEDVRRTEIICHARNGGHNHLSHYDKNPRADRSRLGRATHTVDQTTLDSFSFTDVDFVKIDVEGYEWFVLQGGEATLARERPLLQLEIVENQCRKFGYKPNDILDWLRTLDYRCVSKTRGWIDGAWSKGRGDMDLFFVPCEWRVQLEPRLELFYFG
jgi:FkbM family methyltransferase